MLPVVSTGASSGRARRRRGALDAVGGAGGRRPLEVLERGRLAARGGRLHRVRRTRHGDRATRPRPSAAARRARRPGRPTRCAERRTTGTAPVEACRAGPSVSPLSSTMRSNTSVLASDGCTARPVTNGSVDSRRSGAAPRRAAGAVAAGDVDVGGRRGRAAARTARRRRAPGRRRSRRRASRPVRGARRPRGARRRSLPPTPRRPRGRRGRHDDRARGRSRAGRSGTTPATQVTSGHEPTAAQPTTVATSEEPGQERATARGGTATGDGGRAGGPRLRGAAGRVGGDPVLRAVRSVHGGASCRAPDRPPGAPCPGSAAPRYCWPTGRPGDGLRGRCAGRSPRPRAAPRRTGRPPGTRAAAAGAAACAAPGTPPTGRPARARPVLRDRSRHDGRRRGRIPTGDRGGVSGWASPDTARASPDSCADRPARASGSPLGDVLDGQGERPVVAPAVLDVQEPLAHALVAEPELLDDPQRRTVLGADVDLDAVQLERRRSSGRWPARRRSG